MDCVNENHNIENTTTTTTTNKSWMRLENYETLNNEEKFPSSFHYTFEAYGNSLPPISTISYSYPTNCSYLSAHIFPNNDSFESTKENNDVIKECRDLFLERYLETNRIGRKSKCITKNKAKASALSTSLANISNPIAQRKNAITKSYQSLKSTSSLSESKSFINDSTPQEITTDKQVQQVQQEIDLHKPFLVVDDVQSDYNSKSEDIWNTYMDVLMSISSNKQNYFDISDDIIDDKVNYDYFSNNNNNESNTDDVHLKYQNPNSSLNSSYQSGSDDFVYLPHIVEPSQKMIEENDGDKTDQFISNIFYTPTKSTDVDSINFCVSNPIDIMQNNENSNHKTALLSVPTETTMKYTTNTRNQDDWYNFNCEIEKNFNIFDPYDSFNDSNNANDAYFKSFNKSTNIFI